MTPGSLQPWFTKIEYHSEFAPHIMLLPMNDVDLDEGTPEDSTVVAWDASTPAWSAMVIALCNAMATHFPVTHSFDVASLYEQPSPTGVPIFHASIELAIDGTDASAGYIEATQQTINARDVNGNLAKLVLLDFASNNIFGKFRTVAGADIADIWTEWTALENGWASRKNGRPNTLISTTRTLNEKLRRSYRVA